VEEEREPYRDVMVPGDDHLRHRSRPKQRPLEIGLGRDKLVRELLVVGEPPDQRKNDRDVFDAAGRNANILWFHGVQNDVTGVPDAHSGHECAV
jgi:hypothetical protein